MGISGPSTTGRQPVTRPAYSQRPNVSPGLAERPSLGNIERPVAGGPRPGTSPRPTPLPARPGGERPVIGGGGGRPVIGGGNNIIHGGSHVNIANINNRPGWGLADGGHGHWANHWYNHYIPPHYHGWYHGCWPGHWGPYWYAPIVAGATAWGLSALLPSWGYNYGYTYANPYYVASAAPVYDYSQPIAVNSYDTSASDASADVGGAQAPAPAPESPQQAEAYQLFDRALAAFKTGDYQSALQLDQQALQQSPHDPVMHEISALCMFALGDYKGAAAVLNNLLAVAPGMDWTTLSGLYGNIDAYTTQLRALEDHCRQKPDDGAAWFVLAYQYLVEGYSDSAVQALQKVVKLQPADHVAQRMLDGLSPPPAAQTAAAPPAQPAAIPAAAAAPTTDLVGSWSAKRDGDVFELTVDENNQFTWKATPKDKPTIALAGTLAAAGDAILLQSKDQGTMAAEVKSDGADQFQFVAAGSPPGDKGLLFQRVQGNR
jgi:tetratricopeptide (TPR) repeat protein